ncbi:MULTISPECIES: TauD/TfdA family dioxygenase [unclassified Stenotrophomonas]|uniref:TauD/TfdA dioxygenase family protein n=1 Tax=unclassified Stenotrophomonas TaxID=196198 RepID=UPI0018E2FBB8|nr:MULTISPECIES: TauD/TfdA family dioxygenase [unclassified Stenotrophomonas]
MTTPIIQLQPFGVMLQAASPNDAATDLSVDALRVLARHHHLVLLRGFRGPEDAADLAAYGERWGSIAEWPFGKVLELLEREAPQDHIFDNSAVPLHWDGMYRRQVPEFQIFQCLRAPGPGCGGRTLFSHTARALDQAPAPVRLLWERATGRYDRKMEYYHSVAEAPVVTRHPDRDAAVIRYSAPQDQQGEAFINPASASFTGMGEADAALLHRSLADALHAPSCLYAHAWEAGDLVIADNHSLLHGREAFTSGAPRHLRRLHILGEPPLDNPHLLASA